MSSDSPQEFRPYRLTLGAIAVGLISLAIVWLASSVAVALFVHPPVPATDRFSGAPGDVGGMLRCQGEVETLFAQLNGLMGRLTGGAEPSVVSAGNSSSTAASSQTPAMMRQEFEQSWPERWRAVGASCRFEELRDQGLGAAYDHLAWVHAELQEVHRGYAALLENFLAHHEPRVNDIRRALETSRRTLERGRAAQDAFHAR